MKKYYYEYNTSTGIFLGNCVFSSNIATASSGNSMYESVVSIDSLSKKINTSNGQLIDYQPTQPADTEDYTYSWNNTTKRWDATKTLAKIKKERWELIKADRDAAEFGGFTWDSSEFDSDSMSQSRIQGAVVLSMQAIGASQTLSITWTLKNNTTRTLSETEFVSLGQALSVHVATQHTIGRNLRTAINAATTEAEVTAITWP
jgi:Domain of unknown function (DUF4376)